MIEREKRFIQEAERMDNIVTTSRQSFNLWWVSVDYKAQVVQAKRRLQALMAGLLPARIVGKSFHLAALIREGQNVPNEIVEQAAEARRRIPSGVPAVYGWDAAALPAERRRRDPVLVLQAGEANFFLGFWLEIETFDEGVPEFFGMIAPFAPKRGRGRPKKQLA